MNGTTQNRLKPHRKFHFTSDDKWGYIFIAAAMIIFCVFTLYPVFNAVYTSFFNYKPFGSEYVGLKNYIKVLTDKDFLHAFLTSIKWTVLSLLGQVLVGFTAALALEKSIHCKRAELGAKASIVLACFTTTLSVTNISCTNFFSA